MANAGDLTLHGIASNDCTDLNRNDDILGTFHAAGMSTSIADDDFALPTSAEQTGMEECQNFTASHAALAETTTPSLSSPLRMLTEQLHSFFDCSLKKASLKFADLRLASISGETRIHRSTSDYRVGVVKDLEESTDLESCKQTVTLALVIAAPKSNSPQFAASLFDNYEGPLGLLTVQDMEITSTMDLGIRVAQAK